MERKDDALRENERDFPGCWKELLQSGLESFQCFDLGFEAVFDRLEQAG